MKEMLGVQHCCGQHMAFACATAFSAWLNCTVCFQSRYQLECTGDIHAHTYGYTMQQSKAVPPQAKYTMAGQLMHAIASQHLA